MIRNFLVLSICSLLGLCAVDGTGDSTSKPAADAPGVPATEVAGKDKPAAEAETRQDLGTFVTEGWIGKTGFGYALAYPSLLSGIFQFSEVSLETERHRFIASSETSGTIQAGNIASTFGVLNTGYDLTLNRLRLFVFTNYEFGVLSGLNSNTAIGAGARYTVLKAKYVHLDASAAPIYDRSAYADGILVEALSISTRGRFKFFLTERNTLFVSWFYIVALNNSDNQWHAADIIDNHQISKKLSLRAGYRWRYDTFTGEAAGLAYLLAVFNFL